MKKWNNPEIAELNISETAKKPSKCNAPGGQCVDSNRPNNNGNGYCQQSNCPYYRDYVADSDEIDEDDSNGLS